MFLSSCMHFITVQNHLYLNPLSKKTGNNLKSTESKLIKSNTEPQKSVVTATPMGT